MAALAALPGVAGTAAAQSAASPFPMLVQPPSNEHHVGKIVFAELITPDIAASEQFYGGLFGWTFRDARVGRGQFAQVLHGGAAVAEFAQRVLPPGRPRSAWLTFMAVADADAAAPAAVKYGAKVLYPPRTIPNFGREAILQDPQGAVFAVVASSSGDPADTLAGVGTWIWSSLFTGDPDNGAAFYQRLLGYDVFNLPDDPKGQHLILAAGDYARASVNPLPSNRPNVPPQWLDYLRVDDADAMTAKAQSLGGTVLVSPRLDRHGSKIAVIADPVGAVFGVMEWQEDARPGGAHAGAAK